jgi:hypothetical protein
MFKKKSFAPLKIGAFFCLIFLSACSNVSPWERGTLAKSHMNLQPSLLQSSLRSHQYGSREGASGGGEAAGGGCGCY